VAVGYALTCWEQMELQLAGLYTILNDAAYSLGACLDIEILLDR
jgi:hypothetical protein